ncbi:hypothetical protein C8D76_103150 [Pasteurella langaaensis DSM 22999]|uniref:Uncharacterized protein n=1 Tax=Alitibacter langaaensis DSM 22999 TaxID=1122935 RepID=A0A2U0TAJ0_9PAST|nr:hypothetical protein [Pasteurella langaaensis]PVX40577.1 hypothetical protein C8D76_103150 [Pasteurella langaaensis DSM 22999]
MLINEDIKSVRVGIDETQQGFVATLLINEKLIHATYPQLSRKNAIMLINRKIDRINRINGNRIKPYKE